MNPWLWNQQRQQQLFWMGVAGYHPQQQAPWNGMNFNARALQPQQHFSGIFHRRRQQQIEQRPPKPNTYDIDEISAARRSLGNFLPSSYKSWLPMPEDDLPNTWEGEGGMMEHIVQRFPEPPRGQVTPGTSVYQPDNLTMADDKNVEGTTQDVMDNAKTIAIVGTCDDEANVVNVSDDDSDVEIVTVPASKTNRQNANSSAIVIEDSPQTSRIYEKLKKTAVG